MNCICKNQWSIVAMATGLPSYFYFYWLDNFKAIDFCSFQIKIALNFKSQGTENFLIELFSEEPTPFKI